ncbi:glycosyl hydrolase [Compostibacter hankyongensis]
MKYLFRLSFFACCAVAFFPGCKPDSRQDNATALESVAGTKLEESFKNPPDSLKPGVYWYWLSDNISEKGITKDLEAMAKMGIGTAFIGNIGLDDVPYGKVRVLSPAWWKLTRHAFHEAARLGIHLGFFNSPGWSQSGGPWVKPSQSMRHLVQSEIIVKGPHAISQKLPSVPENFQPVSLQAFPLTEAATRVISAFHPQIQAEPGISGLAALADDDTATAVLFPKGDTMVRIDFTVDTLFTARGLTLYPAAVPFRADAVLQAYEGNSFSTVCKFVLDRSNPNINVGPVPFAPVAVAFPKVQSGKFRLVLSNIHSRAGLSEVVLSEAPPLDHYPEKQLSKMFQSPQPMWDTYMWPAQPAVDDKALVTDPKKVIDLSGKLAADGTLNWEVPEGSWVILRTGMVPTGIKNSPAAPEATGLEVDKMNKEALASHFNAFVGRLWDSLPEADRKAWKYVVEDSYEMGSQNWTDGLAADFKKRYGYDPLPWLPVLSGHIVGSADQSDRFLWDLRRLVADRISSEYVGGLRGLSGQKGLKSWLENYGHWGYPGEFLQYGGQSDVIAGEFWAEGDLGRIELKDASSAAHTYGKREVWAESFTAAGRPWQRYPGELKKRGDWSFTEGVNHTLFHVYIQQAYDSMPGVNAWFGTEINRMNTWFDQGKAWMDYIRRCNFMLQRGAPVADVCYFIGEDAPKMTGICDPPLPDGYSFDYINADVIEHRLSVKDGRLVLPDGTSYRLMVLPPQETMRPEVLEKIRDLVADGATVLGAPPSRSPSLQNYPGCDTTVSRMAATLWQHCDGETVKAVKYKKGNIFRGMSMEEAFQQLGVTPDFGVPEKQPVKYIHRRMADADIYFITNQSDQSLDITPVFRVSDRQPELWDAVSGNLRKLPGFRQMEQGTAVPLKLAPAQSWFVVFRGKAGSSTGTGDNFPETKPLKTLDGPWTVQFDKAMRGPAAPVAFDQLGDWSQRPEDSIRYYSGTAVYTKTFRLDSLPAGQRLLLNLGPVRVMAEVYVNGKAVGNVWTAPWQLDITGAAKAGENTLRIAVVNTWVNRLIGDSRLPEKQRKTWSSLQLYKPDAPLQSSGLLGPVSIHSVKYSE